MAVPLIHISLYTIKIGFILSMRQLKDDSANLLACEIFFDERLYLSAFIDHVQNQARHKSDGSTYCFFVRLIRIPCQYSHERM